MSDLHDEPHQSEEPIDVEAVLLSIRRKDPRYAMAAYRFVLFEGIEYTLRLHLGVPPGEYRHMTGREIAEGLARLAIREFGPLALHVWNWWGIRTTRDWGEIVFNLINNGLLNAQEGDCIEDFDDVYDVATTLAPGTGH